MPKVRCEHYEHCRGSSREDASNWCEHWGEHEKGTREEDCKGVCWASGEAVDFKCTKPTGEGVNK